MPEYRLRSSSPCEGLHLNQDRLPDVSGLRLKQDGSVLFDITRAKVQVSFATSVGPFVDLAEFELETGTADWQEVFFNETTAPFFRLLVLSTASGWQPKPREVQWQSQMVWVERLPSDWVLAASGVSWKTSGPNTQTLGPDKLIDQNSDLLTSRWESAGYPRWHNNWWVTFDFRSGDRALILDTCGIGRVTPKLPEAGMVQGVTGSGASIVWNNAPLSASGSSYRICWCAAYQNCDTADHFSVPIGELTLIGPQAGQSRTCVSGRECRLEGLMGTYLSEESMLAILDTCAQVGVLTGGASKPRLAAPITALGSSGSSADFGLVTASGSFRLCWCSMASLVDVGNVTYSAASNQTGNQTSLLDCFHVDLGMLHVVGPAPTADGRTCISGRDCVLDGFEGTWFDAEHVFVMDTCGQDWVDGTLAAAPVQSSGALVRLSQKPLESMGGQYRLCWCSATAPGNHSLLYTNITLDSSFGCNSATHGAFLTDVGSLMVLGPSPLSQHWTCVSGRTCMLDNIAGVGLSDSDSITVLQTCGNAAVVPRFPSAGQADTLWTHGSQAAWSCYVSAAGGTYRLCWHSSLNLYSNTSAAAPLSLEQTVDFGSLHILGPVPLNQAVTCISGQSCSVDGLTGVGWTQAGDRIAVLNTCGVSAASHRFGNGGIAELFVGFDRSASALWTDATISASGGNYRLCWCGSGDEKFNVTSSLASYNTTFLPHNQSNSSIGAACRNPEDYRVDFGSFQLLGPSDLDMSVTCIAGQSCRIVGVHGIGLSLADNWLVLDTCATSSTPPASFNSGFNESQTSLSGLKNTVVSVTWSRSLNVLGGAYRLCWCAADASCRRSEHFSVDLGEFHILGPNPREQDRTCISGQTCLLDGLTGWHMSSNDRVVILETCGEQMLSPPTGLESWDFAQRSGAIVWATLNSSTNASWQALFLTTRAGQYRLCWCSGGATSLCDQATLPAFDFGALHVLSPSNYVLNTCVSGEACVVQSLQTAEWQDDFAGGGGLFVADTCGSTRSTHHFLLEEAVSNLTVAVSRRVSSSRISTLSGGTYRLCWCSPQAVSPGSCDVPEHFRVEVGMLDMLGPVPLQQDQTCVLGAMCSILASQLGSPDSRVLLLETCGLASVRSISPGRAENTSTTAGSEQQLRFAPFAPRLEGLFRLCWCPGFLDCIFEENFRTDFGQLYLRGPAPLEQHRTCISGHFCDVERFQGLGMENLDAKLMVLDTCSAEGLQTSGIPGTSVALSSTSQRLGDAPLLAPGGHYSLCWCAAASMDGRTNQTCQNLDHFALQFGQLSVLGPAPLKQDFTCVAGRECDFSQFHHTASAARLLVLDTCGTSSMPPGMGMIELTPGLSQTTMMASGGFYRICWCGHWDGSSSSNISYCEDGTDFRVDVGTLMLVGPTPLNQAWTCISGTTCLLNDISGNHLSIYDHYLVLHTCGVQDVASRFPEEGSLFQVSGQCGCTSPLCSSYPPGTNQSLCAACGDFCPMDEKTDPGICGCGTPEVDSDGDGTPDCVDQCPLNPGKTAPGICGCGSLDSDSDLDGIPDCNDQCSGPDFTGGSCCVVVDSDADGLPDCLDQCPHDASKVLAGVCGCHVSDVDSDMDGVLDCLDLCPHDPAKTFPGSCGCGISEADADGDSVPDCIDVCPNSGDFTFQGVQASFGHVSVTAAAGTYRLCWCHSGASCGSRADFIVDVGSLQLLGIQDIRSSRTCVSGQPCFIRRLMDSSESGISLHPMIANFSATPMLVLDTCGVLPVAGNQSLEDGSDFISPQVALNAQRTSGWLAGQLTSAGGLYRLCWCSNAGRCSLVPDFHTDVGELMLLGPFPLSQQVTCIAGLTCRIDGIQGLGIPQADLVRVLDTCGHASGQALTVPTFNASLGMAVDAVSTVATQTFAGGSYRLCWCAAGFQCSLHHDYRVDFGVFSHVGPSPLASQDRTCVTGQACIIERIEGHLLSTDDAYWILETCGTQAPSRLVGQGQAIPQNDSMSISWGDAAHTAVGGQYRLCWCSAFAKCDVAQNFVVDVGGLLLIGPIPQDRTCISGQTCFMKALPGYHLQADDRLLVLDTCGRPSPVVGFPLLQSQVFPNSSTVSGFVAGSVLGFVTSAGGSYQLCWCAASAFHCSLAESFQVNAGSLTLIGPSTDANRAVSRLRICIAGSICTVQSLPGQDLQEDDQLMLLETCGLQGPSQGQMPMPSLQANGTGLALLSNNVTVWSAAGGTYRLCWCASGHSCKSASDFRVDVGQLDVVGPSSVTSPFRWKPGYCQSANASVLAFSYVESMEACWLRCSSSSSNASGLSCGAAEYTPESGFCRLWDGCSIVSSQASQTLVLSAQEKWKAGQDRTCVTGHPCTVDDVLGHLLTEGDAYAVLESCGSTLAWSYTAQSVSGRGGYANPCHCAESMNDTDGDGAIDCIDECPLDPGKIEVGICGCGQADADSDADGVPDCQDRCDLQAEKTLPGICGCSVLDTDTDADGVPDCNDRCPSLPDNSAGTAGCPAAAADLDGDGVPDFLDECPGDSTKTSAGACGCGESDADTDNDGLPDCIDLCPNDAFKIVPGACGCGIPDLDRDGDGTPDCHDKCPSFDAVFGAVSVEFGMLPAGQYRLCWCSRSIKSCAASQEFNVDLGGLSIFGPQIQDRTCISGQPCRFGDLAGDSLDDADRLLILDTCGSSTALIPRWSQSVALPLLSSGSAAAWSSLPTAAGGLYRLCWCTVRPWQAEPVALCDQADRFTVDIGGLTLLGPSPLHQAYTCVSGQPCGLHGLTGLHLTPGDTIMILDTCGNTNFASSLLAAAGWDGLFFRFADAAEASSQLQVANTTQVPLLEVAGGQYRLCWCSAATGSACSSVTEHLVDFGKLRVLGPFPLQQQRTCVSGQTCIFSLQVWDASAQDSLLLLDTCGLDSSIPKVQSTRGHCGKASVVGTVPLQDFNVLLDTTAASASACRVLCDANVDHSRNASCVAAMYKDSLSNMSTSADSRAVGFCQLYSICSLVSDESSDYVVLTLPQANREQNSPLPSMLQLGNVSLSGGAQIAIASWDELVFSSAGGNFRLCWCAGGQVCQTPADFALDAGSFTLIGPFELDSSRTCMSGVSCVVDGVVGVGLSDGDRLLVQDTCGASVSGAQLHFLAANSTEISRRAVSSNNGSIQVLSLPGGQYRLCWCADGFPCVAGQVDIGELVVRGPKPGQHRTCIAGQVCEIPALLGQALDIRDGLFVLDTCSRPGNLLPTIQNFPDAGKLLVTRTMHDASWASSFVVSAAGGDYRLCWCATSDCVSEDLQAHFIDAGTLHLLGPSVLGVAKTCVSGRACAIRYSGNDFFQTAHGFSVGDTLRVSSTCGEASHIPGFGDGTAIDVTASGALFSWGSDAISSAAGSFRLCWCAAGFACAGGESFQVDVGRLLVLGPPSLTMERTCVSGLTCSFSLEPDFDETSGQIMLLSTCSPDPEQGSPPLRPAIAGLPGDEINATNESSRYEVIHWGMDQFTGHGGQFRLCWCGASRCGLVDSFLVDIGSFTLIGPAPLTQDRTCVSGHPCTIEGLQGQHLSAFDHIMLLETCAVAQGLAHVFTSDMSNSSLSRDGLTAKWVLEKISFAGGQYRICWCSSVGPCSTASDFSVDAGSLLIIGPSPLDQRRTCISGDRCPGFYIHGQDLSQNGTVRILDTCGIDTTSEGWPQANTVSLGDPSTILLEFGKPIAAAAGAYRLCWCQPLQHEFENSTTFCALHSQHIVDFGQVTLLGPALLQHRTCVAGQRCVLEDLHLGASVVMPQDTVMVLDTCAHISPIAGWPEGGVFSSLEASGARLSFGASTVTAAAGYYRLCWCADGQCRDGGEAFVTIGEMFFLGPLPLQQDRTCLSGQICDLGNILGLGLDPYKMSSVSGFQFLQDRTTGQYDVKDYFVEVSYDFAASNPSAATWTAVASCAAEQEVTWQNCTWPSTSAPFWRWRITQTWGLSTDPPKPREVQFLSYAQDRLASYASFTRWPSDFSESWIVAASATGTPHQDLSNPLSPIVYGPENLMDGDLTDDSRWWPTGGSTEWSVVFDLRQTDSLAILDTCAVAFAPHPHGSVTALTNPASFPTYGSTLLTAAGGMYRLCWCSRGFDCSLPTAFAVDVGALWMQGPEPLSQHRTCVSGQPCVIEDINVQGASGVLQVLDTCGQGFAYSQLYGWSGTFTQWNETGTVLPRLLLDTGFLTTAGGLYRLCWCASLATCDHPDDVRVDVGSFDVVGVSPLQQDRTCVSGQTCSFDGVTGRYLSSSDQLLILDTCGQAVPSEFLPSISLAVSISDPTASWSDRTLKATTTPALVIGQGAEYRICWCGGGFECTSTQDFRTDVGRFSIVGPYQRQSRTCVSGQQCSLGGIQGNLLSPSDGLLVLDTCGVQVSIPRLPNAGRMEVSLTCQCAAATGDSDMDGVPDCLDECPFDSNRTTVGVCGCGVDDVDSDLDGVPDCLDHCPQDPTKSKSAGLCGCNVPETDSDLDGTPDCLDLCPLDANKQRPGICPGPEWLAMQSMSTHQSSTQLSRMSHLAVDASTSANFFHGSCTLTNAESNPWWYVDLGYLFDVEMLRITPRTDCCDTSLVGVEVWTTPIST